MARKPSYKKKNRLPPFAAILNDEMLSTAYMELKPSAAKAYPHFKRIAGIVLKKSGGHVFDFTYAEAKKLGFARRTFSEIINDVNAKGFIDIVEHGGMRGQRRSNSKYRLSERWKDYGKGQVYDRLTGSYCEKFNTRPRYPSEPEQS